MKKEYIISAIAVSMAMASSAAETPTFPGGDAAIQQYIESAIVYPQTALDNGVEGVVHVGFMVGADGSIKGAKILRPIDPDLESEAIRIVNAMPAWTPADKDGKPIEAPAQVAITFTLP